MSNDAFKPLKEVFIFTKNKQVTRESGRAIKRKVDTYGSVEVYFYIFEPIEEVQQIATEWLRTYNHKRPNMGIGGLTPAMKLKMAA